MADWNIRPRATSCRHCNKPFAVGDKGHSLLLLDGEQWIRHDYCPICFSQHKEVSTQHQTNVWTFKVPPSQKPKVAEVVKRETAEHLLRTLIHRHDPADVGMIYILAILLERKKQLVERRTIVDEAGHRVRIYEQRATGDVFTILDPGLRPMDVPELQKQIVALLEGKTSLDEPSPAVGEAPAPEEKAPEEKAAVDVAAAQTMAGLEAQPLADAEGLDLSMEKMHEAGLPFDEPVM